MRIEFSRSHFCSNADLAIRRLSQKWNFQLNSKRVYQTPTRTGWANLATHQQKPGQVNASAHPSRDMLLTPAEAKDNKR